MCSKCTQLAKHTRIHAAFHTYFEINYTKPQWQFSLHTHTNELFWFQKKVIPFSNIWIKKQKDVKKLSTKKSCFTHAHIHQLYIWKKSNEMQLAFYFWTIFWEWYFCIQCGCIQMYHIIISLKLVAFVTVCKPRVYFSVVCFCFRLAIHAIVVVGDAHFWLNQTRATVARDFHFWFFFFGSTHIQTSIEP